MPKQTLQNFSGGINTRLDQRRIADDEAQECKDVDLAGVKLKPSKGVNISTPPDGDVKTHGVWVSDEEADTFAEMGDTIIKSYESKTPEFVTVNQNGDISTSRKIGVPATPKQPQVEKLTASGSALTDKEAVCSWTIEWREKQTKTVAQGNRDGNPTDIDATGSMSIPKDDRIFVDVRGNVNYFNSSNGTLVQRSHSATATTDAQLYSVSLLHKETAYFTGDFFVGVSNSGITKVALSNYAMTNHTFATPSWPVYKGVGTDCRDGYYTAPTTKTSVTSSADSASVYVSMDYEGGVWGFNHYQKHPDQKGSFPKKRTPSSYTFSEKEWSNQKTIRKYHLKGPAYYVGIHMDTAFYTPSIENKGTRTSTYANQVLSAHAHPNQSAGSILGGWYDDERNYHMNETIFKWFSGSGPIWAGFNLWGMQDEPLKYMANAPHWGCATAGSVSSGASPSTYPVKMPDGSSGTAKLQPTMVLSGSPYYRDGYIDSHHNQTQAKIHNWYYTDATGVFHGDGEITDYATPIRANSDGTGDWLYGSGDPSTGLQRKAYGEFGGWMGGIFYVPANSFMSIDVGVCPLYLWKCGASANNLPSNATEFSAYKSDIVEARSQGGNFCFSVNNTSDNCTDFYVRTGNIAWFNKHPDFEGTRSAESYNAGVLQLKVYHDLSAGGQGLKFTTSDGTVLVKGLADTDSYSLFTGEGNDGVTHKLPMDGTSTRKETVVHKVALTASNGVVPTIETETLPDYKIADKTYNYSSTPWHQVMGMTKTHGGGYSGISATVNNIAQTPATEFTYTGLQEANVGSVINAIPEVKINFEGLRTRITSTILPFKKVIRDYDFNAYGGKSSTYTESHYIGVKQTTASYTANYFRNAGDIIQVTANHSFYANANGIVIQGGTTSDFYSPNTMDIRPLSTSFETTINHTKIVDSFFDVQMDADYISFYNPSLTILKVSDGTTLNRASFDISEEVKSFSLAGSPTSGFIGYSPTVNSTSLKILDIANSNRIAQFQVPFSKLVVTGRAHSSDPVNSRVKGFLWSDTVGGYTHYKHCWVWYIEELIGKTLGLGDPAGYVTYVLLRDVLYNTDDENIMYIQVTHDATNLHRTRDSDGNAFLIWGPSAYIHLNLKLPEEIAGTFSGVSTSGSNTAVTGCSQEMMRTVMEHDHVVIDGADRWVESKSGTTITLSLASTVTTEEKLTFSRYMHPASFWPHENDWNAIEIKDSFPNFHNEGTGYSGSQKVDVGANFLETPPVAHMPIQKIGRNVGGVMGGQYAWRIDNDNASVTYTQKIYHFWVKLDKALTDLNRNGNPFGYGGTTFHVRVWQVGMINMYNALANLKYQYQVSALRNIGTSHSPRYIESAPSAESNATTLGASSDYISILGTTLQLYPDDSTIDKLRIYRTGGAYASYGWMKDISIAGGIATSVADSDPVIGSTALTPLTAVGPVPEDKAKGSFLRFVTYVSGLFFGAYGKQLRVSEYGNPHSWPIVGYHDLFGVITGIREYNGEAIVFTENSTYRVRGSSYDDISVNKIPERQGLPVANSKSVVEIMNALFWISNDGVCMYQNGAINVISVGKFTKFPVLDSPLGGAKDNIVYFFTKTGEGLICDLRKADPAFSRLSTNADKSVYYSQSDDRLFIKSVATSSTGTFGEGANSSLSFTSKVFDGGDASAYKVYFGFQVSYKGSGTISFTFDEKGTDEFSLPSVSSEVTRYFEFLTAHQGKKFSIQVTGDIEITEISIGQELRTAYAEKKRWEFADLVYEGSCEIVALVDEDEVELTPLVPASPATSSVRVYFPPDTLGYIPHLRNSANGSLISVTYGSNEL